MKLVYSHLTLFLVTWPIIVGVCLPAYADMTLIGNVDGDPKTCPKDPCPKHVGCHCCSTLTPQKVSLINTPTTWFQTLLGGKYKATDGWNLHYVGGNVNLKGKFDVKYYRCYNDCPKLMGAEIEVDFVPDGDSLIKDVLWMQGLKWDFRCYDESTIDDRDFLIELGNLEPGDQVMYGPFYPFQDEDEDPPQWQTNDQYDCFYDKPGRLCPDCPSSKYATFETYACWWDDYFKADGSIVDVGSPGHHVWIHEGFSWGVTLSCVPDPASVTLGLLGLGTAVSVLRRRKVLR